MLRNVRNTNMPMDTFVKKVTELNLYLVLLPLDGQSVPKLEKPYHSCLPTLSIRHLCQFVALQLSRQPKEVEIYIRKNKDACLSANYTRKYETKPEQPNGLERLWEENSLSDLYPSLATCQRRSGPCYSIGPLCSGSGISTERHYLLPSHFRDEVIPSQLCPSQRKDVKPHSYHATN
ncbi:Putative E3 ubiquitin-protein ligase RING1a [Zea mays]|uniref:Putative E3 ubiquitin-protein ligase RING1a n=1 Tax=Zea mays TaxID=4577 RepID=A0A1D6J7L2_MAIZE|nr:Putative E3 ubiquitin-protein ligase RING1a [Zea mays]